MKKLRLSFEGKILCEGALDFMKLDWLIPEKVLMIQ